jgi:hypothetical protein
MNPRYAGKPFLQLVDCYVLDAIGYLDAVSDAKLAVMEPKLHAEYGVTGHWREIVEARMNFPAGFRGAVREVWNAGTAKFQAANGRAADPFEFTRHFVDKHFPH